MPPTLEFAPLKTKNSYRSVSIGQDAVQILKDQQRKTNSEYVFPSPTGGPISPDSVLKMLHQVLKRAGLPEIRFHDMRHPNVKPKTKNIYFPYRINIQLMPQETYLRNNISHQPKLYKKIAQIHGEGGSAADQLLKVRQPKQRVNRSSALSAGGFVNRRRSF